MLVEREHDLHAVLLGDAPGVHVGGVQPAEVVVHAAVIHQVGADRIDPHELHALEEGFSAGCAGSKGARRKARRSGGAPARLGGFAEGERLLAVARARPAQAFDPQLERVVERRCAVFLRRRVDLTVEPVEAECDQLFKIDVRAGDAAVAVAGARP